MQPNHQVLVVGAGFSGIGAAILLDRAGFPDYLVVEAGDGVGGAWHWNTYPGVAVDIPSFSYQFSFEKQATWSRVYAPGTELKAYAEHCVDKYALRDRIRFGCTITGLGYDDDTAVWTATTADGDTISARYVVNATGVFSQPKRPEIDGLDDFAGDVMHTARWDHSLELTGKRVAVVGTGASAVQAIPEIAKAASDLVVFQRTPIWCFPKPDVPLALPLRAALGHVPGVERAARLASQAFVEATFPFAAHFHTLLPTARVGETIARDYLRRAVKDPEVREKLTPSYAVGCKRPSFSNAFLPAFNRDNVYLETTAIERFTEKGVRCVDGTDHLADVVVLATGFKVFDPDNMPPFPIEARGVQLGRWWAENRSQAYEGISVPGFPNLFSILGPYGYNGSSYFNLIETQMHHITRLLRAARKQRASAVEVTREANQRYFESMLSRRKRQVFFNSDCASSNSYYFDANGDVPFRASPTLETMWRSGHFPLSDYEFSRSA